MIPRAREQIIHSSGTLDPQLDSQADPQLDPPTDTHLATEDGPDEH